MNKGNTFCNTVALDSFFRQTGKALKAANISSNGFRSSPVDLIQGGTDRYKSGAIEESTFSSENNQPNPEYFRKSNPNGFPWPGHYFGVPTPLGNPDPSGTEVWNTIEYEMHVLRKDLRVERIVLQTYAGQLGTLPYHTFDMLKSIAYLNTEAIAFVVHSTLIKGKTGKRKPHRNEPLTFIKRGAMEWQEYFTEDQLKATEEFRRMHNPSNTTDPQRPFTPSIFSGYTTHWNRREYIQRTPGSNS